MIEQKQQQKIARLQIRTLSDWLGSKHSSTVLSGLIIIRYYSNVVRQQLLTNIEAGEKFGKALDIAMDVIRKTPHTR